MRYCPHCKKPSIQMSGDCPFCGNDLDTSPGGGGATSPAQVAPAAVKAATASPAELEDQGSIQLDLGAQISARAGPSAEDLDLGLDDGDAAEFTGFDPKDQPDAFEAERLADFGKPSTSPFAAVAYSFRVKKRSSELGMELDKLEHELKKSKEERDEALARLGERARVAGYSSTVADKIVSALDAAEARASGAEGATETERQLHQERLQQIQVQVDQFKQVMAEPRARETALTGELGKREEQKRRLVAEIQQIENELRVSQAAIAQASQPQGDNPAAPQSSEAKVLAAQHQARLPAIQARHAELRGHLTQLDAHLTKVRGELQTTRAELDRIDGQRQTHLRAFSAEQTRFREALGQVSSKTNQAAENVRGRLTQLGGIVRMDGPEDAWASELYPILDGHIKRTAEIWSKRDMYAQAAKSFNPSMVKQGRMVLLVGGGILGFGLLVLIITLAVT